MDTIVDRLLFDSIEIGWVQGAHTSDPDSTTLRTAALRHTAERVALAQGVLAFVPQDPSPRDIVITAVRDFRVNGTTVAGLPFVNVAWIRVGVTVFHRKIVLSRDTGIPRSPGGTCAV